MKNLMKPLLLVIGVALLAALGTTPLMAQTLVDPATLFIGNPLTCPLGAGCPAFNGEAVVVPSTSINLYLEYPTAAPPQRSLARQHIPLQR